MLDFISAPHFLPLFFHANHELIDTQLGFRGHKRRRRFIGCKNHRAEPLTFPLNLDDRTGIARRTL